MIPTSTNALGSIVDGTRGTAVFFNFTANLAPALTLPTDQKGIGDPTAPSDPASLKLNKKL